MKIKAKGEKRGSRKRKAEKERKEEKKNRAQQSLCKCGDFRFPIEN